MSYYYEFEPYMEEFMESGLGYGLITNLWSSALSIAAYVLASLALYTIAKRRGIKNPWLSWIPVVNCWIVGSLSDQYRYVVKGEVKNKRKILLTLNIINVVIGVAIGVVAVVMAVGAVSSAMGIRDDAELVGTVLGALISVLALCLPLIGVTIAIKVYHYMAMYDIYTSCTPQNNVIFLVLSIIFSITEPFFLFFTRNRDDGMPPRKPEPQAYVPPREPWNNPDIQ